MLSSEHLHTDPLDTDNHGSQRLNTDHMQSERLNTDHMQSDNLHTEHGLVDDFPPIQTPKTELRTDRDNASSARPMVPSPRGYD